MPASGGAADSASLSLIQLLGVVAEQVAQHLGGVLAQKGWWHSDRAGSAIDLPRRADLADAPGPWMLDLDSHLTLGRERAGERLIDAEDRTGRDPKLLEAPQPSLASVSPQVAFDGTDHLRPRGLAHRIGGEPRVVRKLRGVDGLAELHELGIRRDRDVDEAVAYSKGSVGRDRRVVVALLTRDLSGREEPTGLVGEQRQQRVVERDVDAAPAAGSASLHQRGQD